jgi:hypothetical protein
MRLYLKVATSMQIVHQISTVIQAESENIAEKKNDH